MTKLILSIVTTLQSVKRQNKNRHRMSSELTNKKNDLTKEMTANFLQEHQITTCYQTHFVVCK